MRPFVIKLLEAVMPAAAIVVVIASFVMLPMCAAVVGSLFSSPQPVSDITMDGARYVLTCEERLSGGINLTLYRCKDQFDNTCTPVDYGTGGESCRDNLSLQAKNGSIELKDPATSSDLWPANPDPNP